MRVICTDDIPTKCCNSDRIASVPKFGDIDIVFEVKIYKGHELYFLERFGDDIAFDSYHFSPLSDIDETELIKEREHDICKIS